MLKIGIVGLPNVGKSTLFEALTKKEVDISNYPFCTINPNIGVVEVPDQRLKALSKAFFRPKIVGRFFFDQKFFDQKFWSKKIDFFENQNFQNYFSTTKN